MMCIIHAIGSAVKRNKSLQLCFTGFLVFMACSTKHPKCHIFGCHTTQNVGMLLHCILYTRDHALKILKSLVDTYCTSGKDFYTVYDKGYLTNMMPALGAYCSCMLQPFFKKRNVLLSWLNVLWQLYFHHMIGLIFWGMRVIHCCCCFFFCRMLSLSLSLSLGQLAHNCAAVVFSKEYAIYLCQMLNL